MCSLTPLANAVMPPGFCAYDLPGVSIDQARSVLSVGTDAFLALERGSNSVVQFVGTADQGGYNRTVIAQASRLNHGLAVHDGYVYASSDQFVYRWSFTNLTSLDNNVMGDVEAIIENINADGKGGAPFGHTTRTLAFDESERLYVSVGSGSNIDTDSFRSRIRRFDLSSDSNMTFPFDFQNGEVFADGLRNEVGLAFDRHGALWGVENGADNLNREDLGGDIHADNPVRTFLMRGGKNCYIVHGSAMQIPDTRCKNCYKGRRAQSISRGGRWEALGLSVLLDRIQSTRSAWTRKGYRLGLAHFPRHCG